MEWKQRLKDQPYPVAAAVFMFCAAGLIFASLATDSRRLFLSAGGFIAAGIVASFLALFGRDGLFRR